jgi:competence protein ComEA
VLVIIAGSIIIAARWDRGGAIEITLEPARDFTGEVSISGEVNNPGVYPFGDDDSLADILRAAGGVTDNADPTRIEIIVPGVGDGEEPQKVNINRAGAWLLAALPGIGEVRAQAIIDYRLGNGPFRDIYELLKVEGIGETTFENIKHLITVTD